MGVGEALELILVSKIAMTMSKHKEKYKKWRKDNSQWVSYDTTLATNVLFSFV